MPRGYRLFFFAALGCVVFAVVLAWLLQPKQPNLTGDSGYREQSANYRAGGSDCEPSKIRALPIGLREGKADACAEAEEQHRATSNNLLEARRAASAADAAAIAAYQQARIAAWGFGAGIMTLFAAIAAAVFAERAAHYTKSNYLSYRAREAADLVPAVAINGPMIDAYIENLGASPAAIHLINSAILLTKPTGPIKFFFPGQGSINPVAIKPGGRHSFGQFAFPQGVDKAYFIGAIFYATIFEDTHLIPCFVELDRAKGTAIPHFDADWSIWENELEKFKRTRKQ